MPITVPMIEEKEFKTKVRGYDPVEVDEFLDEICDEMIVMQEEIARLQAQLAQTKRDMAYVQPAPQQRPAPVQTQDVSESAQKLMANAQRLYDETIAQAKEEAAAIVARAQDSARSDLTEEKAALEKEIADLKAAAQSYRQRLLATVDEWRAQISDGNLD